MDVSRLIPDCKPVKCNVDVWILAVDDLTGDGRPDILLGTTMFDSKWREANKAGPIVLMRNDGKGSFEANSLADGSPFVSRKHPREAVVADFNGDGRKDVFVVSNGFDVSPWPGEENLLLLQDGGTLRDATANLPKVKAMHHGAAAGDFNGDGSPDILVVTNHGASRTDSYFLVNDGRGHFSESDLKDRFPASFLKNESGSEDRAKYTTAHVADLLGTGKSDILLAQSGDDAAKAKRFKGFRDSRVVFNDGTDRWPRENTVQFPPGRWGFATYTLGYAIADVNGDGRQDIVMTTQHNVPGNYAWMGLDLRLLLGEGGKEFKEVSAESFWDQSRWGDLKNILPTHIALPDLNGDGAPDLVVSSLSPVRSDTPGEFPYVVAYNDGKGKFTPIDPEWLSASYRGRQLWPADVNGDGRVDLVGLSLIGEMKGSEFYTRGVKIDYFENAKAK